MLTTRGRCGYMLVTKVDAAQRWRWTSAMGALAAASHRQAGVARHRSDPRQSWSAPCDPWRSWCDATCGNGTPSRPLPSRRTRSRAFVRRRRRPSPPASAPLTHEPVHLFGVGIGTCGQNMNVPGAASQVPARQTLGCPRPLDPQRVRTLRRRRHLRRLHLRQVSRAVSGRAYDLLRRPQSRGAAGKAACVPAGRGRPSARSAAELADSAERCTGGRSRRRNSQPLTSA